MRCWATGRSNMQVQNSGVSQRGCGRRRWVAGERGVQPPAWTAPPCSSGPPRSASSRWAAQLLPWALRRSTRCLRSSSSSSRLRGSGSRSRSRTSRCLVLVSPRPGGPASGGRQRYVNAAYSCARSVPIVAHTRVHGSMAATDVQPHWTRTLSLPHPTASARRHHVSQPGALLWPLHFIASNVFLQETEHLLDLIRAVGVGRWKKMLDSIQDPDALIKRRKPVPF